MLTHTTHPDKIHLQIVGYPFKVVWEPFAICKWLSHDFEGITGCLNEAKWQVEPCSIDRTPQQQSHWAPLYTSWLQAVVTLAGCSDQTHVLPRPSGAEQEKLAPVQQHGSLCFYKAQIKKGRSGVQQCCQGLPGMWGGQLLMYVVLPAEHTFMTFQTTAPLLFSQGNL